VGGDGAESTPLLRSTSAIVNARDAAARGPIRRSSRVAPDGLPLFLTDGFRDQGEYLTALLLTHYGKWDAATAPARRNGPDQAALDATGSEAPLRQVVQDPGGARRLTGSHRVCWLLEAVNMSWPTPGGHQQGLVGG